MDEMELMMHLHRNNKRQDRVVKTLQILQLHWLR